MPRRTDIRKILIIATPEVRSIDLGGVRRFAPKPPVLEDLWWEAPHA